MTREVYLQYLQSEMWKQRRLGHLKRHPYCQICGIDRFECLDLYNRDLEVHHVSYRNVGNEQPGDLQTLCPRHHEEEWDEATAYDAQGNRLGTARKKRVD